MISSRLCRTEARKRRRGHRLIDNTNANNLDKNVCTKAQVEAAKKKGWIVKEYIGNNKWAEYAGSENPTPTPKTYSVTIAPTENGTIKIKGKGSTTSPLLQKAQS